MPDDDLVVRKQMMSTWTNFALRGDPTPPGSEYSWLPVTERIQEDTEEWFFNFAGEESAMAGSREILERLAFWETLMEDK